VGHAENVLSRLRNHVANKDFWSRVVVFTSKDKNLTKAHVKYLEARLVELAGLAGRTRLENGNVPQLPALPRSDRDAMEEFLGPLRVLLGALGFPILHKISSKDETERPTNGAPLTGWAGTRLYFSLAKRNIDAEGAVTDEGFVVFEGSVGDGEIRHHLAKGYRAYREQLTEDGSIRCEDESIRLMRDVLFTSPSAAAEVLSGGARNGREAWKDENGTTLKALEDALAVSSPDD
jgi:hypothetical protein